MQVTVNTQNRANVVAAKANNSRFAAQMPPESADTVSFGATRKPMTFLQKLGFAIGGLSLSSSLLMPANAQTVKKPRAVTPAETQQILRNAKKPVPQKVRKRRIGEQKAHQRAVRQRVQRHQDGTEHFLILDGNQNIAK